MVQKNNWNNLLDTMIMLLLDYYAWLVSFCFKLRRDQKSLMRWERLVKLLWVKKYINKCLASNRMGVLGIL